VIVGLGNPGIQYSETRHNVGFKVVQKLATEFYLRFQPESNNYHSCKGEFENEKFFLLLPQTYMNLSGLAVKEFYEKYKVALNNILVVCDDFNLPLGKVRLKLKGSDGGHKGLYSIISELDSKEFPRLRIGIGKNFKDENSTEFVLSPFNFEELHQIEKAINFSLEICKKFLMGGIKEAMDYYSKNLKLLNENPN